MKTTIPRFFQVLIVALTGGACDPAGPTPDVDEATAVVNGLEDLPVSSDSAEVGNTSVSPAFAPAVQFGSPKTIDGTPNQDAEPPQLASSGKHVFIVWHEFPTATASVPDVYISRSTNKGADFSSRFNLSDSDAIDSRDEDLTVSGKNVFVAWSEDGGASINFRRSTNRAASFDPVKKLNDAAGAVHPQIASSGHDVFVVWEATGQGGNTDIFLAHSKDDGHSFAKEINISNNAGPSEFPQVAVSENRVVVTWRDSTTPGLDFEIFFAQGK